MFDRHMCTTICVCVLHICIFNMYSQQHSKAIYKIGMYLPRGQHRIPAQTKEYKQDQIMLGQNQG